MAGVPGAALTAGKYGVGFAMLAAAFGDFTDADDDSIFGKADSALSTDTLRWGLSFFMEDEDINNSGILEALDGSEGALNALMGSMLVLPESAKIYGIIPSLAWLAYELYQANKEGRLNKLFSREAADTSQEISAQAEANLRSAAQDFEQVNAARPGGGADLDAIRSKIRNIIQNNPDIIAQIEDQQLQSSPNGMIMVAEADREELDPELDPEIQIS